MKKERIRKVKLPSENFDERPSNALIEFLILHSTECDLESTLKILTDNKSSYPVSAHYVIAENGDIYELVAERYRAWHAGESKWGHYERLNANSIGIEIVNIQGQPFKESQMHSVLALSQEIIGKYSIPARHVLAHSDIALGRKVDPGPLFNWKWLADNKVGLFPSPPFAIESIGKKPWNDFFSTHESYLNFIGENEILNPQRSSSNPEVILKLQNILKFIGYNVPLTGSYDTQTSHAIKAFQAKFRQHRVDGEADKETLELLLNYIFLLS